MFALAVVMVMRAAEAEGTPARFHGEVAVGGGAIFSSASGFGAGFHFEAGVVVADEYILSVRANVAAQPFFGFLSGFLTFGVSFGFPISSRFAISFSAAGAGILNQPMGIAVLAPIRVTFRPGEEGARRGLVFGFEVAPGLFVWGITGRGATLMIPGPALSGMLTVGYAVW